VKADVRDAEAVRGTQSFVHTLSAVWKRPSLTALEVLWRWAFGAPALALLVYEWLRVLHATPLDFAALNRMSLTDLTGDAATLAETGALLLPGVLRVAAWLAPLLLVVWAAVSSVGRFLVLRQVDVRAQARLGTVMSLQAIRIAALAGSFAVWFECLRVAARVAVSEPMAAGLEPNLVLYCALAIVATLVLFVLWAVLSWALSVAPLLAMLRDLGVGDSLRAALRVGPAKSKLIEINLVMGIVKIALIVLAMVASACPLPFESVATPEFMLWWYGFVSILYFLASDLFHVVRLMSYVEMWQAFRGADAG
jgi:hypothetical protein